MKAFEKMKTGDKGQEQINININEILQSQLPMAFLNIKLR